MSVCPKCGKPALNQAFHSQDDLFCSPLQSPECWRVEQVYDHDLRRWVMTHNPGEPAPTAAEMNERR